MRTMKRTTMHRLAVMALLSAACVSNVSAFTTTSTIHKITPTPTITSLSPSSFSSMNSAPLLQFEEQKRRSNSALSALEGAGTDGATNHLVTYLLETLINVGVPALIWVVAAGITTKFLVSAFDGGKKGGENDGDMMRLMDGDFGTPVDELYDDLYSPSKPSNSPPSFLNNFKKPGSSSSQSPRNLGIPTKQYLKVTNLNDKYDSYRYSLTSATKSKSFAAAELRSKNFNNALTKSINASPLELSNKQQVKMLQAEKSFLKEGRILMKELLVLQKALTSSVIQEQVQELLEKEDEEEDEETENGVIDAEIESESKNNTTATTSEDTKKSKDDDDKKKKKKSQKSSNKDLLKKIEKKNTELLELELDFIAELINTLGLERTASIRRTLLGNINANAAAPAGALLSSLQERPLSAVLASLSGVTDESNDGSTGRKSLFITEFPGDVTASQVAELREEVTGIIRSSQPGDEALLILQSGGGTVTGYGLAAAQLQRFKQHGLKLTICVEQVAASGGYMMCCVADHVVASPFAVLGSIGVISDIPNVYERLKKEGVEFQTVTAGKYKRTLTPTKKVTPQDLAKSKEDIEDILTLFKGFVKENRPQLDIDSVATGETWFGTDALEKGLCDEIGTADDILLQYIDNGYDVYDVKYEPEVEFSSKLLGLPVGGVSSSSSSSRQKESGGLVRGLIRSLVRTFTEEVVSSIQDVQKEQLMMGSEGGVEKKYMMKDPNDVANRIRMED